MPILSADIKYYKSFDGDSEGGAISPTEEITDATLENLFDSVTADEAENGLTDYRKFFVYNNHGSISWESVVAWIQSISPSPDDEIAMGIGTSLDDDGSNVLATLSANSQIILVSSGSDTRVVTLWGEDENGALTSENKTLNGTTPVTSTTTFSRLYLVSVPSGLVTRTITIKKGTTTIGSIGSNKLSAINYINPTTKELGFKFGNIAPAASRAIWLRRVVAAGAAAYDADQVTVRVEGETP